MPTTNQNEFDPTQTKSETLNPPAPAAQKAPVAATAGPAVEKEEDVRSYQIPGVVDKPIAGVSLSEEALKVKAILAKEPRTPFFIPLDQGERPGSYRSVTINGYRCEIKKNVMVNLPQSLIQLLMQSMQVEAEALADNERNLNNADAGTRRALGLE